MIGDPLAGAIAKQYPAKYPGDAGAAAAALRASLNLALREHVHLAAAATGAALGGCDAEFKAVASALDANSAAVAKAIGSVYGPDAEKAFLPLWRKHIGMVVDYTVGKATGDRARQDRAVSELVAYAQDFVAFLAGANPNLTQAVVADFGEAPRGDAQGRDRRSGGQGSGAGLHGPAHRRGPHADDRRSAGGGDRDPVSRALLGGSAARHAPGRRARGASSLRVSP